MLSRNDKSTSSKNDFKVNNPKIQLILSFLRLIITL